MAYFRKRGNTWSFTIDVGKDPVTGERKQKTKGGFKTKKEAQLAAGEIEKEIADNVYVDEKSITFSEFAKDWLREYKPTVKISTFVMRQSMIKILNSFFGALQIRSITKKQYQKMLDELTKDFSDSTISSIHSTGSMIFKNAVKYEIIKVDPTKFATITRKKLTIEEIENGDLPRYLEKDELSLFLETSKKVHHHQDYLIFLTLAYTGMRIGELTALKWKDVSYTEKTISITKTCYLEKGKSENFILLTPKTKKSIRTIIVDDVILNEIKTHRANQLETKMRQRNIYMDNDFVFTSIKTPGAPINRHPLNRKMQRLLKKCGINKKLTLHSLRHTHTSLLSEAGVDLIEIMERLGHEDDSITKSIYLHVTKAKKATAAQKFSDLMQNVVKM